MPDYRWGIFLADADAGPHDRLRRPHGRAGLAGGARASTATRCAASSSPRATPSRPASSSSACSATPRPSLYDLRNLFQVNVEEGRHLWAMVYLLHTLLRPRRPRGGRGAAPAPLRQPRQAAHPRRLQRAVRPTGSPSSCSRCSPTATASISCSRWPRAGFDPLSRTTRFMLTEEAHHMFVGETGVRARRPAHRRADEAGSRTSDVRDAGRHRPLDMIQRT